MAKKIAFSVFIFVVALELMLRVKGMYVTSNEKAMNMYMYRYRTSTPTWVHSWKKNERIDYHQAEFRYTNQCNEFGVRELPLDSFLKDTATVKILCLGDSFTEGDGAPYDSSWVRRVEFLTNQNKKNKYAFYNAGVCGSDVFFNHQWLKTDVAKLKPQVVVECLNSSDIDDVIWRGGQERFNTNGTTKGKVGPRWEFFYKFSHLFRAFVHGVLKYNYNLTKPSQEAEAIARIKEELIRNAAYCQQQGVVYKVLLQPCPHEIRDSSVVNKLFFNQLSTLPFAINLTKPLSNKLTPQNINRYSWPINGHYNSQGYQILGDVIYDEAISKIIKPNN